MSMWHENRTRSKLLQPYVMIKYSRLISISWCASKVHLFRLPHATIRTRENWFLFSIMQPPRASTAPDTSNSRRVCMLINYTPSRHRHRLMTSRMNARYTSVCIHTWVYITPIPCVHECKRGPFLIRNLNARRHERTTATITRNAKRAQGNGKRTNERKRSIMRKLISHLWVVRNTLSVRQRCVQYLW